MSERRRILLLILIMAMVALMIGGISITLLYQAAFQEAELRLIDTAQSQARLLEAMARHEAGSIDDVAETTLKQIRDAHSRYAGIGETGEFTLARLEGDLMVFLLSHRYHDLELPKPVPFDGELAEPMRRSLSGHSGAVVGLDYRGETVLAAFEPVAELDWGIVAKIDLTEIQAPFVRAGLTALLAGFLIVIMGAVLFVRTTNPLLRQLVESEEQLRDMANNVPGVVAQFVLKKDGSFSIPYVGEGTRVLYGFSPEALQADPSLLFSLCSPEDSTRIEAEMAQSSQELVVFDLEYRITTPNAEDKWVRTTSVPKKLANGDVLWNGVTLDITDRKQAEKLLLEERDRAKRYLDIAGLIILALDNNGKVTLINQKGCEILGYTNEEVIGKDWFQTFLPEHMREDVRDIFHRIINGEISDLTDVEGFCIITKSGAEKLLLWHNSLILLCRL